jgi:hypothetical protein
MATFLARITCHINSLFLIWGKIFRSRKCEIRIPRIKLPLEGSIPDNEKKIFEKFHVQWGKKYQGKYLKNELISLYSHLMGGPPEI